MKQELQDELYGKYPKIFRQKDLPMRRPACVGDRLWRWLVWAH